MSILDGAVLQCRKWCQCEQFGPDQVIPKHDFISECPNAVAVGEPGGSEPWWKCPCPGSIPCPQCSAPPV